MINIIGRHEFERLVDHYGGSQLVFPKLDAAVRQIKVRVIAEMSAARCSVRDIALNTGYTQRRVHQIRAELGINDQYDQLSMF